MQVFVGRPAKSSVPPDLGALREALVGKTIAFRSEPFPNRGKPSAILALDKHGSPELVTDPAALEGDRLAGGKALKTKVSSVWMWPLSCLLTLGCGIVGGRLVRQPKVE